MHNSRRIPEGASVTLADIVDDVEARLSKQAHSGTSLWSALVESARRMRGDGCDGILIEQAVKCGCDILARLSDQDVMAVWKDTEIGLMAAEVDEASQLREEMLSDIESEICERIAERVCAGAMQK